MRVTNHRVSTAQPHCGCGESIPVEGMGTVWRCTFPGCGQWIDTRDPTADHLFPMRILKTCSCWNVTGLIFSGASSVDDIPDWLCDSCHLPVDYIPITSGKTTTLETGVAGEGGDE